tara:strand:+ start:19825 stop:20415 length:591 start_codon:yes stop_codon:yes gene_type:complete
MSDSIKKLEEIEEAREARQRIVEQNGNSALHYEDPDEDIESSPVKERECTISSTGDLTGVVYGGCPSHHVEDEEERFEFNFTQDLVGDEFLPVDIVATQSEIDIGTNALVSQPNFKKITDSIADLLKYKNEKYGNAALEPLEIFQGKCKVGQRLDDKLARVKNGGELQKNDIADLIGYLTLVCVENGWDSFEEFKD